MLQRNIFPNFQKKVHEKIRKTEGLVVKEDASGYEVEAEIGRLDIMTHSATRGSRAVFNTKVDLFPKIGQKEMYTSACYDTLKLRLATIIPSFRKCEEILNRLRWQDNGENKIKSRTIADSVVMEGSKIVEYIDLKAKQILASCGYDSATGKPIEIYEAQKQIASSEIKLIDESIIDKTIADYNQGKEKEFHIDKLQIHEVFEDVKHSVNISVDDVGSVEQKGTGRMKGSPQKETRHYVKNTVIHIQQGLNKYILDGLGIKKMLIVLVAFLLNNDLATNMAIIFFTDGAVDIKNPISDIFGWRPYKIILDWYHLKKKCQERLSMAMKGREIRNNTLQKLLPLLWLGKVESAIEYLRSLDSKKVRNKDEIEKLIAYFEKNRSYIPCYALRKRLGLRISSNRGEKANDLVVATRQKHNGMSWSKLGSSGLANINAIFLNNENENWINSRVLDFKLISKPSKMSA